jgi:hypothetical protein
MICQGELQLVGRQGKTSFLDNKDRAADRLEPLVVVQANDGLVRFADGARVCVGHQKWRRRCRDGKRDTHPGGVDNDSAGYGREVFSCSPDQRPIPPDVDDLEIENIRDCVVTASLEVIGERRGCRVDLQQRVTLADFSVKANRSRAMNAGYQVGAKATTSCSTHSRVPHRS